MNNYDKIIVFGGAGFVGCNLVSLLQRHYKDITVVDTLWFWDDEADYRKNANIDPLVKVIKADIRNKNIIDILSPDDSVINLACLSNDPMSDVSPLFTRDVSYNGVMNLINSAAKKGVKKFIQTSSTSVYGIKEGRWVDELSEEEPITQYSKIKTEIDNYLRYLMKYSEMDITILRPATLYGYSPRLRLDILINSLIIRCIEEKAMFVHGGGQYRPCLHVDDLCLAYLSCLKNIKSKNQIFNIVNENFTVNEVVDIIKSFNPDVTLHRQHVVDQRSYQVSSNKITKMLDVEFNKRVKTEIPLLQQQIAAGNFKRENSISLEVVKRVLTNDKTYSKSE